MMNNIYYDIIAGSRSYGLNIATSDIDRPQVSDHWKIYCVEGGYNIIRVPQEEFVKRATLKYDKAYYLQWWFPDEWLSDNELTKFMQAEREKYISERKKRTYEVLFNFAEGLRAHSDWLYAGYPKRLAYSTLFYAIPARYAEGRPFAEAHRTDGELRNHLLAMRRHEMELSQAQEINREWRRKAQEAAAWFEGEEDEEYVRWVEETLKRLVGIGQDKKG